MSGFLRGERSREDCALSLLVLFPLIWAVIPALTVHWLFAGQHLDEATQARLAQRERLGWAERHRKYLAFLYPFLLFQTCWWLLALRHHLLALFPTRYEMSLTMVFGSLVAGATSEGGGAVAFPVMTLLLHIPPGVARDFSLMIQSAGEYLLIFETYDILFVFISPSRLLALYRPSFLSLPFSLFSVLSPSLLLCLPLPPPHLSAPAGMAASAFTVCYMRVRVEWHSVVYSSAGAALSIVLGLEFMDDWLTRECGPGRL